jgi:hypothetical protein
MDIVQRPFGIQEITFRQAGIDRVHVEALCQHMRQRADEVDLASHATAHGKLVMRVRMTRPELDVRTYVQAAAAARLAELASLLDQFLRM